MKTFNLLFITLILSIAHSNAQGKVTQINTKNKDLYITTSIEYPITGTYQYVNGTEPIVLLNADGTGIFQFEDLSKKSITWGLECDENGILKFKDGFDSAAYSLWYKSNDTGFNSEPEDSNDWVLVEFSIHFNTKKMYIMGQRVKNYVD